LFFGDLGEAGFDDFFEEGGGEGFVGGEADCAFAYFKVGEVGAECVDDEIAHGEEAAVVFEGGDGADTAVVFESGDAVADGFDGAFGQAERMAARTFWRVEWAGSGRRA
jgi:hypothetical protein